MTRPGLTWRGVDRILLAGGSTLGRFHQNIDKEFEEKLDEVSNAPCPSVGGMTTTHDEEVDMYRVSTDQSRQDYAELIAVEGALRGIGLGIGHRIGSFARSDRT